MFTIKQPNKIIFGFNTAKNYSFPNKSLIITTKGSEKRGWLEYLGINDFFIYDKVVPNPSLEIVYEICNKFSNNDVDTIIHDQQGSDPSAPDVGHCIVYFKSGGLFIRQAGSNLAWTRLSEEGTGRDRSVPCVKDITSTSSRDEREESNS